MENTTSTKAVKNTLGRGSSGIFEEAVVAICCRPGVTVGTAVAEVGSLSSKVMIGSQGGRSQATRDKAGVVTVMGVRVEAEVKVVSQIEFFDFG